MYSSVKYILEVFQRMNCSARPSGDVGPTRLCPMPVLRRCVASSQQPERIDAANLSAAEVKTNRVLESNVNEPSYETPPGKGDVKSDAAHGTKKKRKKKKGGAQDTREDVNNENTESEVVEAEGTAADAEHDAEEQREPKGTRPSKMNVIPVCEWLHGGGCGRGGGGGGLELGLI